MRHLYEDHKFKPDTLAVIHAAIEIVEQYLAHGMKLTLRQLYYRFIAGDLLPEAWTDDKSGSKNTQKNYKRLGSIVGKARMAGLLDWDAIEDRTRGVKSLSHWTSPADIVASCASQFTVDRWEGQNNYVEVWYEKDALTGVFSDPCNDLDVPFFSCRGYGSLSELRVAGRRLKRFAAQGRKPVVLHFGDMDPSGLDMTRDNRDRLSTFAEVDVELIRIALNMDQIEQYDPPPNPAKTTDSRFEFYRAEHGEDSWELDALEPQVLRELCREHVESHLDRNLFDHQQEKQDHGRQILSRISKRWPQVEEYFGDGDPEGSDSGE